MTGAAGMTDALSGHQTMRLSIQGQRIPTLGPTGDCCTPECALCVGQMSCSVLLALVEPGVKRSYVPVASGLPHTRSMDPATRYTSPDFRPPRIRSL